MKPKPGEWPPPIVSAIPRMDPEVRREGNNRRQRERVLGAKERGLCTKCRQEPAIPNKARCEECCKKNREYLTAKKQRPDRPGMPESKPAVDVPKDFFWFIQDRLIWAMYRQEE